MVYCLHLLLIFLCFFLGNDFMPHIPSVNIRTSGIDYLMNAYKDTIGNTNENLYYPVDFFEKVSDVKNTNIEKVNNSSNRP